MASVFPPPPTIPPRKRPLAERVADAIKGAVEEVGLYASRKIFIDAQLADRGGIPRLKFKDALRAVMYADRDGFLQPMGWEGWTAGCDFTLTQTNVAGGAIVVEISPGFGSEFKPMSGKQFNTGTHSVNISLLNAGLGTYALLAFVASGVSTTGSFPMIGTSGAGNIVDQGGMSPNIVSADDILRLSQGEAGVQNDTMRVIVRLRIKHKNQLPTVSIANSTNPGSVTGLPATPFTVFE